MGCCRSQLEIVSTSSVMREIKEVDIEVIPPSEKGSFQSEITYIARNDPERLFQKTDVKVCFKANQILEPDSQMEERKTFQKISQKTQSIKEGKDIKMTKQTEPYERQQ